MKKIFVPLLFLSIITGFTNCTQAARTAFDIRAITSFLEIPGVTAQEIAAIRELQEQRSSFVYGMMLTTEAFIDYNGDMKGFAVHLCEWLTNIFGIPFIPQLFTWEALFDGLESGEIDFTGHLMATEERRQVFFMTDAIVHRPVKYFRLTGSTPLSVIRETRLPRFALLEGSSTADSVMHHAIEDFEAVFVADYPDAYALLRNAEIDAFVSIGAVEPMFNILGDVETAYFFPLIYSTASFTTQNAALEPVISVVQRALENGGVQFFGELFRKGQQEYSRHQLFMQLTSEERAFIMDNPVIPLAAEFDNYPVSFFNTRQNEWQGISFDVLRKIECLTGLEFQVINDSTTQWPELLEMLESGNAMIISELVRTREREGRFLWPDSAFFTDRPALISGSDHRNISFHEVLSASVGLSRGTVYTELFWEWFSVHNNTIEFDSQRESLEALMRGEVDMVMNSIGSLLYLTHFRELPGFKANIVFDASFESKFGFNIDAEVLRSIVSKALNMIDANTISEQWLHRTYDYRAKLAEAQRPWIMGAAGLFFFSLILMFIMFQIKRREGKRLEGLVKLRTSELEHESFKAHSASRAKSAFLATMSHEIRTPLNAITGIAESQLQDEMLDHKYRDALEKIYNSGDLLLSIINDLLDMSKIDANKFELTPVEYETASLIHDVVNINLVRFSSKPIEFKLYVDENIPLALTGDELRIKQILNNLLSNAFKYTQEGGVTLSVSAESAADGNFFLIFIVKDTGRGMTEEQVSRLFDEYARFDMNANRTTQGTGLGMSITRNLVDLMGGEIYVDSEVGRGTIICLRLPQGDAGAQALGKEAAKRLEKFRENNLTHSRRVQILREPMPYGSVLVVDDSEMNLYVARALLSPYELSIETADSGFAAIEKIKAGNVYDIIFMDYMMPVMDGIEAAGIIRKLGYLHPIVALTADAITGRAGFFLENGFDDFISKPIDIRQMDALLKKMIRDKQPREVIEALREQRENVQQKGETDMNNVTSGFLDIVKKIDGINTEIALSRVSGMENMYYDTLSLFHKKLRNECTIMSGFIEAGDVKSFSIAVHSMKSQLSTIGAMELSKTAQALEAAAKNNESDYCTANFPDFNEKLLNLHKQISGIFPAETSGNKAGTKPGDQAYLREYVTKALEAASNFDQDMAIDALNKLQGYDFGEKTSAALDDALSAIDNFDFDVLTEILNKI